MTFAGGIAVIVVSCHCAFTIRSELSCKDALVAQKDSLQIFLFAFVAQVAHNVQFNFADAFKGAVCF